MEVKKYDGNFIQVTEEVIEEKVFERVYLPNGIIIFPFTAEGKLLMIVEKRLHETPTNRLKFVSGHIEKGEEVLATANRELQEEIGLKASNLEILHHHCSNGTVNNNLYFVIATDLVESKIPNPDGEDSIVSITPYEIQEVKDRVFTGEISVNFPFLGLLKLFSRKKVIY